jgi:DNA (cytosine-5)-methyltransferase 1
MRYMDLFCGAGGGSCGLTSLGWECVGAYDNDERALAAYRANFPTHPAVAHDLEQPLPVTPPPVDVVLGGPPCQDFTTTCEERVCRLKRRAKLTRCFAERCLELAPEWIVFENVRFAAKKPEIAEMRALLEAAGYATDGRVVSARAIGMTQPRFRFIMIAHRTSADMVRAAWHAFDVLAAGCAPPPTLRETLRAHGIETEKNHCYYPVPRTDARQPSVFALDSADGPYFTVRARTRPMPRTYVFRPRDSTADPADVLDVRTEHAKAIQCFPREFALPPSRVVADRLLGNAIPPPLAALIGRALAQAKLHR